MKSNFDYLENDYPKIYKELKECEEYFYSDEIFLLKIRKSLEEIFLQIKVENKEEKRFQENDLFSYINIFIQEEKDKKEYHQLRKKCNSAIHGGSKNLKEISFEEKKNDLLLIFRLTKKLKNIRKDNLVLDIKKLSLTQVKEITKEVIKELEVEVVKEKIVEIIKYKKRGVLDTIEDVFKMYKGKEMPEEIEKKLYTLKDEKTTKEILEREILNFKIKYSVKFFSDTDFFKNKMIDDILDDKERLNLLLEKSKSENAIDQYKLGLYYLNISQKDLGIKYLELAAKEDFVLSQLKLGEIYEEIDKNIAIKWYKEAIELDSKEAKEKLKIIVGEEKNYKSKNILKEFYNRMRGKK